MTHTDQAAGTPGGLAVTPAERDLLQVLEALAGPEPSVRIAQLAGRPKNAADRTLRRLMARGWAARTLARPARWQVTGCGSAVLAALPPLHRRTVNEWRRATSPVTAGEVTAVMLRIARGCADEAGLPQTCWPSQWFGPEHFYGPQHLLAIAAAHDGRTPSDAYPGVGPILTLLPATWWAGR